MLKKVLIYHYSIMFRSLLWAVGLDHMQLLKLGMQAGLSLNPQIGNFKRAPASNQVEMAYLCVCGHACLHPYLK
jgi:hypothetical protein